MSYRSGWIAGFLTALAGRALFERALLLRFRRDVEQLNAGDHTRLLAAYADGAVLRFNEGPHRWSGEHRGREAIDRFLAEFTRAGLHGEVRAVWLSGPPWAATLVARFDDRAEAPDGREIYSNRVVIVVRTRWGKIVEQEDFYQDTARILSLEEELRALGITPAQV